MVRQAVKKGRKNANKKSARRKRKLPHDSNGKVIRSHPKFGTSKLEQDFAHNFLDKMNVEYVWQFEAKDIQRSYDFYLPSHNVLIEVDGDYWHANPEKYDVGNWDSLTPTQKHDIMVDRIKDKWALTHGIPIYRIWESDIRNKPEKVMDRLTEIVNGHGKKHLLQENKRKRHKNKIEQ